ncbi:MAG: dihydropteroate synthase, partial [Verrucomicrobiales bacterium]|nr:dihydropteroate synthase [Verrucomicrobiales bacterium]
MVWKCRHHRFAFPRPALVMGILNVTPDSFSDGGRFLESAAAVDQGLRMEAEGAELLDIGGESTRPGATPVAAAEELRRVIPVVSELSRRARIPISVDTRKAEVAREALAAGASVVNDVSAARPDPDMSAVLATTGAGYVAMHMQGTPETMQHQPRYGDVVREVGEFFEDRLLALEREGVSREQVALDPGIGFGKTLDHTLDLLGRLAEFTRRGRPLVLGVSRKSFLGGLLG